jgi:hypothetical protein
MGRCGLRSRIENRRNFEEKGATPLAHRRPSRAAGSGADWTAAGFEGGRWLIDLGSAVKPQRNLGNELAGSDSGSGLGSK